MNIVLKYRWHVAQVIALVIVAYFSNLVLTWLVVVPIHELRPQDVAALPPGCPAAYVWRRSNVWTCFWNGSIGSSPWLFLLSCVVLVASFWFIVRCSVSGRGFPIQRERRRSHA